MSRGSRSPAQRPVRAREQPPDDGWRSLVGTAHPVPWLAEQESDRAALLVWLGSRLSGFVVAAACWLFVDLGEQVTPYFQAFGRWDFVHFAGIAMYGYGGEPTGVPNEAFFPGFPALLWLGNALGLPHVVAGLLVSLIAGAVAAVALARLGDLEGGRGVGRLAVVVWVFAPPAVFLALPYTESLFLAFAIPAWLAARRNDWMAGRAARRRGLHDSGKWSVSRGRALGGVGDRARCPRLVSACLAGPASAAARSMDALPALADW